MAKKSNSLPTLNAAPVEYKVTKEDRERERKYRAEDGLRTIQRAEEIKADKQCMADIKALATKQVNDLKKFMK